MTTSVLLWHEKLYFALKNKSIVQDMVAHGLSL